MRILSYISILILVGGLFSFATFVKVEAADGTVINESHTGTMILADESTSTENGGDESGDVVDLYNPVGTESITELINRLAYNLQIIATPIVAVMVLVGAFQILFASGDPEKFKKGKKTILYSVVGYAIILIAGGITSIIESVLTP